MTTVSTVGLSFKLAKTPRDEHEAGRFVDRIEDAATEHVLSRPVVAGVPSGNFEGLLS